MDNQPQHYEQVLDKYHEVGEIVNPEYKRLKSEIDHAIYVESRMVKSALMDIFRKSTQDVGINDVYYGWPESSNEIISFRKKLEKISKGYNAPFDQVYTVGNNFYTRWISTASKLKALKDKVVKTATKRAESKQVAQVAMEKKFTDSSSLISLFESHMAEYVAGAKERARNFIDAKIQILKDNDYDLNKVAPAPKSTMSRASYIMSNDKRKMYYSFVVRKDRSNIPVKDSEPYIVEVDYSRVDKFVEEAGRGAEASYRAFMQKMIEKIGKPVVNAKMTGNIWTGATLTVECNDGEEQVWKTQMIVNFSKYQRMFNQFPSRRMK